MSYDRRKNYYIIFDTETCNSFVDERGKLDLNYSLVYDIGWQVIDKQGNVYVKRSFINSEIFFDEKELMTSAYYAEKIPQYLQDIRDKKRTVANFYTIRETFKDDCKEWHVKAAVAHNAGFDYRVTNNTQRWLTKSKYRYFLPYGLPIYDTLRMARETIGQEKGYKNFCERNGYLTKYNQPRFTAEILYKYLSGQEDFTESHTGLEDVEIEAEIFRVCINKHKPMTKSPWGESVLKNRNRVGA